MNTRIQSRRGSLLIVAMLFSAIIALGLGTYLTLANNALKYSQRSFLANDSMNVTETGIELAMTAINSSDWSGWDVSGGNATRTFGTFNYSQGATGQVKVWVQSYSGSSPTVVAKGTISPQTGAPIVKMVEVSGFIQRPLFGKGLVGRNGLVFHGNNPSVDSWDSRRNNDGTDRASPVNYSAAVAHDKGSIAAVNVSATADVNNADIWGTASVGASSSSAVDVGPNGRVGPYGTGSGVKNSDYISTNFTANLPIIAAPTPSAGDTNVIASSISSDLTLPRTGDKYVTDATTGKVTYYYQFPSITGGNLAITANKNVVFLPTAGAGTNAISMSGNHDSITVGSGATLNIYTPANISMSGQAYMRNDNGTSDTSSIQIWGTSTTSQSITITGNGSLACTCYAPNASIDAKGGGNSGSIYGSFIGNTINLSGNDSFHYDEALSRMGQTGLYTPTRWIELDGASDRAIYASHF